MLDAWLSVSPGSLATLHGSSPENALLRLDLLCQRAGVPSQLPLIAAAVQLIVHLEREEYVRPRVVEIVRVDGLDAQGRFVLHHFAPPEAAALARGARLPRGVVPLGVSVRA
jgi:Flp pilus assembly CpaF family ATPase